MRKQYIPVLLGQLSAAILASTGQTAEALPSPTSLDEVVVTASRHPENVNEISSNLTVIDEKEIRQSVGRTVGDLLVEKNFGHIHKYSNDLIAIGLRGFRSDSLGNDLQGHVLTLLDGRRAGTGNVAKILTKNVERIEIIRGPGAVQYGSAGMGGVVNIITRRGRDNSAFVESGAGTFGRYENTVGGTVKEGGFDFAGSYSYGARDNYDTGGGDRYVNTGIDWNNGESANLGYSFTENNRLGLVFTRFSVDDAGSPGYFSKADPDDSSTKSNYSLDGNFQGQTESGKYSWLTRYFFGRDKNSWLDGTAFDTDGGDTDLGSGNTTDQQGAQAQVSGQFGPAALTGGFDWLDYQVENSWRPNRTGYINPAVFALGKISFWDERLFVNAGLRYDWYAVEVEEPKGRDEEQGRVTPKVGLAWMVMEGLKLRAQYAEGFTMPSADQLAADYPSFGARIVGNPDLDPEKSRTYEGGMDFARGGFHGALGYFHTDFSDKITIDYLADGNTTWNNVGEATIAGFETELSYNLGRLLASAWEVKPYLNLTYLTQLEDEETGDDLLYVNAANAAAGLVVGNGAGSFARLHVAWTGSQEVQDWESGVYPAPVTKMDDFIVVSLAASYRFLETSKYGSFAVRGELENLFDEDYAYVKGYPMPGRSIFASLRWEY